MATFTATAGNDNFQGTAAADDFYLYLPYADYQRTMNGGGLTASDPIDRLFLSGDMSSNVIPFLHIGLTISNIEQVYLSNFGGNLYVWGDFLNSSATHKVEFFGQGAGADKFMLMYESPLTSEVIFHGGDGNDFWEMSNGFSLGAGGSLEFYGEGGNDTIAGFGLLDGGSGNDSISAHPGSWSHVYAGTGDDTVYSSSANIYLDGGDGTDTLVLVSYSGAGSAFTNFEILKVGTARVSFSQLSQVSQIYAWDPTSVLGASFKFFDGGTFSFQTLAASPWLLRISIDDENAFNYQIVGSAYVNYFVGGAGNDIFIGGDSYNDLNGGLGDDYLVGGAGDDLLHGSLGANSLLGGGGNDRLNLGGFTSYPYTPIYCYNAAYGGNGDDAISVVDGRWVYQSGIIDGGTGYDTLTTDGDLRWYTISNVEKLQGNGLSLHATVSQLNGFQSISAAGITIYVSGSGTLDLGPKLGDPNVGIILFGETSGDLTLLGTKNNDTLVGGQGTNVLYGGDGTDLLYSQGSSSSAAITYAYGGSGNDTLLGGASADCLFGGDGNDAIVSNSALIASPGSSYVDGGSGNDWIKLNGAGDVALGGTGDDAIYAEGTFAYMSGGDGNDTLQGGLSADVLDGGSGTDAITGSAGNDYMLGGGGIDYFFLGGGMQADDVDYIADFTPGEDWLVRSLPMDASVTFIDTAYGVDVVFVIDGLLHQVFLLGVHDINAVKSSSYIYVL